MLNLQGQVYLSWRGIHSSFIESGRFLGSRTERTNNNSSNNQINGTNGFGIKFKRTNEDYGEMDFERPHGTMLTRNRNPEMLSEVSVIKRPYTRNF